MLLLRWEWSCASEVQTNEGGLEEIKRYEQRWCQLPS